MSRPRHIRQAAKAKRQPFDVAANDETPLTWADFYAQIDEVVTDDAYQLDQLADANSNSKELNGSRG